MKAYILKQEDFDKLLLKLDRDPRHGTKGGSSRTVRPEEQAIWDEVHQFYNYQFRTWIDEVQR